MISYLDLANQNLQEAINYKNHIIVGEIASFTTHSMRMDLINSKYGIQDVIKQ